MAEAGCLEFQHTCHAALPVSFAAMRPQTGRPLRCRNASRWRFVLVITRFPLCAQCRDRVAARPVSLACAQSPAAFYNGKSVDMQIGNSVGGGYDLQARLVGQINPV